MNARFITFEGIDGAGKSTHAAWYAERLRERGEEVVATREPGGTPLAERLRDLLLAEPMSTETETLLMFAARREHIERLIRPALARGAWVVCDRFTDSTFAYQGAGRGVPGPCIEALEQWVQAGLQPDRTYLFDLPSEIAAARRARSREADRFEVENRAFFDRVRGGYLRRLELDPHRILAIDSSRPVADVRKILEEDLVSLCS